MWLAVTACQAADRAIYQVLSPMLFNEIHVDRKLPRRIDPEHIVFAGVGKTADEVWPFLDRNESGNEEEEYEEDQGFDDEEERGVEGGVAP